MTLFGNKHIPISSLGEEYQDFIITCYAPTKTFNLAGIRCSGIVIPNDSLREKILWWFKQNRTVQENIFAEPVFIAAYTECDDYLEQLKQYIETNVLFLKTYLESEMPKIKLVYPEALYLMWLDCSNLQLNSDQVDEFFIFKSNVAVNRGRMFGPEGNNFERLNIGCPKLILNTALDRLNKEYKKLF